MKDSVNIIRGTTPYTCTKGGRTRGRLTGQSSSEDGSVVESRVQFPMMEHVFCFDMQSIKGEYNSMLVPDELSSNNNLVKIKDVLGVFRHESSLYFWAISVPYGGFGRSHQNP